MRLHQWIIIPIHLLLAVQDVMVVSLLAFGTETLRSYRAVERLPLVIRKLALVVQPELYNVRRPHNFRIVHKSNRDFIVVHPVIVVRLQTLLALVVHQVVEQI